MLFLYVMWSLITMGAILIWIMLINLMKTSTKIEGTIVEKIMFDNVLGQRYSWIVSFEDGSEQRRLYNTIYKSSKTEPKPGDSVVMRKVKTRKHDRYLSNLQYRTLVVLPVMASVFILAYWYILIFYQASVN